MTATAEDEADPSRSSPVHQDIPSGGVEDQVHSRLDEILQHAYKNDLIRDYTLDSFSISHVFTKLVRGTLPRVNNDGFTDCSDLADLELPTPILRNEVISVTPAALALICEVRCEISDEQVKALMQPLIDRHDTSNHRLELPILMTDNERDMRDFRIDMDSRQPVCIRDHLLPLDPVNVVDGEGMELSAAVRWEAEAFLTKLPGEKLQVTKESLKLLAELVKNDYSKDQLSFLVGEAGEIGYQKVTASHIYEPPRIALSGPSRGDGWLTLEKHIQNFGLEKFELPISQQAGYAYFVPAPGAYLIQIPSKPSTSIFGDDLKAAEARLFEEDDWGTLASPILNDLLDTARPGENKEAFLGAALLMEASNQDPTRGYPNTHKIEVPILLPDIPPELPLLPGSEGFRQFIAKELDINAKLHSAVIENFPGDRLEKHLEQVAGTTIKSIEQEQLQAVDAIARVPIPVMDFSFAEPERTRLCQNAAWMFKWIRCGNERLFKLPRWPRNKSTEGKLVWRPINSYAVPVPTAETIEAAEGLLDTFIDVPCDDEALQSWDSNQRRGHRLAVLEDKESDEDIEPQLATPRPWTASSLAESLRKRAPESSDAARLKRQRHSEDRFTKKQSSGNSSQCLLSGGSPGASVKLLANFMELHAPKKWTVSKYFSSNKGEQPVLLLPSLKRSPTQVCDSEKAKAKAKALARIAIRAPHPPISIPSTSSITAFISLSAPRLMIRCLERLIPGLVLMERDYTKHNSTWSPGSVCPEELVPALAYDADVTVSPSTGLMITSMIMIRQKPRPGKRSSGLQEKIEKVSRRYERLIVIIGEGGSDETLTPMSPSDAIALAELQGFAGGLDCDILVHYIGGGDDTLSRWVAFFVCRYALNNAQVQERLLEVETLWELWLRRAGLNVYAAQAVAGQLKIPKTEDGRTSTGHGLAAFVTMTRAERKHRFGQMVGVRVLERVSWIVDQVWNRF